MSRMSAMLAAIALALAMGCEDNADYLDHNPPAGQGSLVVVNNTADDIDVFLDGEKVTRANDWSDRIVDVAPGEHRLVLDEHDGSRSASEDIDILDGRLTVVTVSLSAFDNSDYHVDIEFED
jgi:hypothetical protein